MSTHVVTDAGNNSWSAAWRALWTSWRPVWFRYLSYVVLVLLALGLGLRYILRPRHCEECDALRATPTGPAAGSPPKEQPGQPVDEGYVSDDENEG